MRRSKACIVSGSLTFTCGNPPPCKWSNATMRLPLDPFRLPLISLAGCLNQHQPDVIDYLQEEHRVRRAQFGNKRLRLNDDQRCLSPSGSALELNPAALWDSRSSAVRFFLSLLLSTLRLSISRTLRPCSEDLAKLPHPSEVVCRDRSLRKAAAPKEEAKSWEVLPAQPVDATPSSLLI